MGRRFAGAGLFRRNGRSGLYLPGGGPAPSDPTQIGDGATIFLRSSGITQALGTIAAWDSEGSNAARFSAPAEVNRPLAYEQGSLTIGRFDGLSTDGDRIAAETTLTLARPYTVGIVCAVRSLPAVRNVIADLDSTSGRAQLTAYGGSPPFFRWFDNNVQLETTTPIVAGEFYSLILRSNTSAGAPGTSAILLNGSVEETAAVNQNTPNACAWTLGALVAGTSQSALDLVDFAVWSGEYLDDDEVAQLVAYHEHIKGKL